MGTPMLAAAKMTARVWNLARLGALNSYLVNQVEC